MQADSQISSAEGAPAACADALRRGLMLLDILAIKEPLEVFQNQPSAGPRHALNRLFSSLNMAFKGGVQQSGQQQSTETVIPTSSSHSFAEEFIEM